MSIGTYTIISKLLPCESKEEKGEEKGEEKEVRSLVVHVSCPLPPRAHIIIGLNCPIKNGKYNCIPSSTTVQLVCCWFSWLQELATVEQGLKLSRHHRRNFSLNPNFPSASTSSMLHPLSQLCEQQFCRTKFSPRQILHQGR